MVRGAGVVGNEVLLVFVDDGSPKSPFLEEYLKVTGGGGTGMNMVALRINENIPWNQVSETNTNDLQ